MQWAEIDGKQRLLVGGKVEPLHPQPDVRPGVEAGRARRLLPRQGAGGNDIASAVRRARADPSPAYRDRDARLARDGRAGPRRRVLVPDARRRHRGGAAARRPGAARRVPRVQPLARRGLGLRLPGPHLRARRTSRSPIPTGAVAELEWALERAAPASSCMRPRPVPHRAGGTRSPGDPMFDPFWALRRRGRRRRRLPRAATPATAATSTTGEPSGDFEAFQFDRRCAGDDERSRAARHVRAC